MQASAKELQAIIDEAWKNPEFQEASKTNLTIDNSLNHQGVVFPVLYEIVPRYSKTLL